MPKTRHYHSQLVLHTIFNTIVVAYRATGLYKSFNTLGMGKLYTIVKRKKCIGCQYSALQIKVKLFGFINTLAQCIYAAGLPATFANQLLVFYQCDCIAFQVLAYQIGKYKVTFFCCSGSSAAYFFPLVVVAFIHILLSTCR